MQAHMKIGIFANTFTRPSVEEVFDAVQAYRIDYIEFNTSCVGLPEMPAQIDEATIARVRSAAGQRGIKLASLSGMFNMIHPDPQQRADGLQRLEVLMQAAKPLGAEEVTLCTGTRDPDNMWRRHPANDDADAWRDLLASMSTATAMAATYNVTLAFEPEVANVVDSASKARRLLDEIDSPHLKVIFDGANIFHKGELARMHEHLAEAVDLLAGDIRLAHAKDLDRDGEAGHLAAGHGLLDYPYYIGLLHGAGFHGPILLHGLREDQVDGCVQMLRRCLEGLNAT